MILVNEFISDAGIALNLFRDMRKARKNGCNVEIKKVTDMPFINCGPGFLDTVEGCRLISGDHSVYENVKQVFDGLSHELKNKLIFSPKDGEFIARAQFWKSVLKELMALIDEPIALIDGQVKAFEEKRKQERRENIKSIYGSLIGDMKK